MIKQKIKLGLGVLSMALFAVALTSAANAAALTWSVDTNVTMTDLGTVAFTIKSGSHATSLVVGTNSIHPVVPLSDSFTVTYPYQVTISPASGSGGSGSTATQSCVGSLNTITITTTGASAGDYTLTPTSIACPSGGGGGGGGGAVSTADTTPPSNASVAINSGASTTNTASVTLTLSATDNVGVVWVEVSNDPSFVGASYQNYATTLPWLLTTGDGVKTVYARFKDLAQNVSAVVSDTITLNTQPGAVVTPTPTTTTTPTDRAALIAQIQQQIAALIVQIQQMTAGASGQVPPGILTKALSVGSKGNDVTVLQNFLRAQGHMTASATGTFGPLTKVALEKFQEKWGIAKKGDAGYGVFGPKTRAKVNELNK